MVYRVSSRYIGKTIPSAVFLSLSLVSVKQQRSYPMVIEQIVRGTTEGLPRIPDTVFQGVVYLSPTLTRLPREYSRTGFVILETYQSFNGRITFGYTLMSFANMSTDDAISILGFSTLPFPLATQNLTVTDMRCIGSTESNCQVE